MILWQLTNVHVTGNTELSERENWRRKGNRNTQQRSTPGGSQRLKLKTTGLTLTSPVLGVKMGL